MKRSLLIGLFAVTMLALAVPASANRFSRNDDTHPLRIVGYITHAIGTGLEYGVMRPVHWFVSRDNMDIVFGHQPRLVDEGTYFEWLHGDYSPSIAVERAKRAQAARQMAK